MPYAYQCCVFGACNSYKAASQWEEQMGSEEEDLQKKALSLFPIHTDNNCKSYNLTLRGQETHRLTNLSNIIQRCDHRL